MQITPVVIPDKRFGLILFANGGLSSTASASMIAGAQTIWLGESAAAGLAPVRNGTAVPVTE